MITLFTETALHSWKISIALEEMHLPYEWRHIHIGDGEQQAPEFLKLSPFGVVPVIIDHDANDLVLTESCAILIYLAEKSGMLLPKEPAARAHVLQWMMFHATNIAPAQSAMDVLALEVESPIVDAVNFYRKRALRLYDVLERQLEGREYIAGDFSIADIAHWTYVGTAEWVGVDISKHRNVQRWLERMSARPACRKGLNVPPMPQPEDMPESVAIYRGYMAAAHAMLDRSLAKKAREVTLPRSKIWQDAVARRSKV